MSTSVTLSSSSSTLASSQEIRDRGSTFISGIYRANTVDEARGVLREQRQGAVDRRSGEAYTIAAWRCMVVKPSRTGLGGPDDFEVDEGWEDGGERWAGKRVLEVMQREGVMDTVVVVHRWFGGTLLGPIRFTHVDACASEVCRRFRKVEEMETWVQTLNRLDDSLGNLRVQLATLRGQDSSSSHAIPEGLESKHKAPDYRAMQQALDFAKAKRLIHARERAINNTKTLIEKYNSQLRSDKCANGDDSPIITQE